MTQGRPRDAAIDDAARQACRELLIESGWEGTSLSAVADRAGVSRPALYRRWPTKTQLVFDTLFGWAEDLLPKQVDQTPQQWLRDAVEISFELFSDPAVRAGVPGLLAVLASDDEMRTALWERAGLPAVEIIEGQLPSSDDAERRRALAQAVLGVLAGAPLFLQVFGRETDASIRIVLTSLLETIATQTT